MTISSQEAAQIIRNQNSNLPRNAEATFAESRPGFWAVWNGNYPDTRIVAYVRINDGDVSH